MAVGVAAQEMVVGAAVWAKAVGEAVWAKAVGAAARARAEEEAVLEVPEGHWAEAVLVELIYRRFERQEGWAKAEGVEEAVGVAVWVLAEEAEGEAARAMAGEEEEGMAVRAMAEAVEGAAESVMAAEGTAAQATVEEAVLDLAEAVWEAVGAWEAKDEVAVAEDLAQAVAVEVEVEKD